VSLDATIEQARDLLAGFRALSHRKMFGGAGLYAEGGMFALVISDEIFLKATGPFAEKLETLGSTPFIYDGKKGKPVQMSYWRVPESALDDPEEAIALAEEALACAHQAKT